MEKEFLPYDESLALKELGFDEDCFGYYVNAELDLTWKFSDCSLYQDTHISILTPLYQQAFRWFRKKYGLQSYINPELSFSYNNPKYTVIFIKTTKNFTTYKDDTIWVRENIERKRFNSYGEAELELLKKLIEIVKNK